MIRRILYMTAIVALSSCCTKKNCNGVVAGSKPADIKQEIVAIDEEEPMGNSTFWGELLGRACKESTKENICLSPLSAQFAMAMVANGAEGKTQKEIYSTMQLGDDINSHFRKLMDVPNEQSKLEIASSIWINEKLDVKEQFIATNKENFDALVERIKFDDHAVGRINGWCKENTNGRIPSIIDKVKADDMMYLINAIYFKAKWQEPFARHNTTKKKFTTEKGEEVEVDMMMQRNSAAYYKDEILAITSKSYNGRYSMLLVLPNEGVTCSQAARHLAENYSTYIKEMDRCDVMLSLPKFKTNFFTSLKPMLTEMGIKRAFSKNAQFGGISDKPLLISDVMQKTFISVDEEGTEAAAVTSVMVGLLSAARPDKVEIITFDRPFIYAIIDKYSNEVLFTGKVGDPTKE